MVLQVSLFRWQPLLVIERYRMAPKLLLSSALAVGTPYPNVVDRLDARQTAAEDTICVSSGGSLKYEFLSENRSDVSMFDGSAVFGYDSVEDKLHAQSRICHL